MFRGTKLFKCEKCGTEFTAPDIEWNATSFSQPVKCPKCGNMTNNTPSLFARIKHLFE